MYHRALSSGETVSISSVVLIRTGHEEALPMAANSPASLSLLGVGGRVEMGREGRSVCACVFVSWPTYACAYQQEAARDRSHRRARPGDICSRLFFFLV